MARNMLEYSGLGVNMRPQETLRYPDEKFYFDDGELVVKSELLGEHVPNVLRVDDRAVVGIVVDNEGRERGIEYNELGWRGGFYPGYQLKKIEASHDRVEWQWEIDDDEYGDARCAGPITGSYEVQAGDILIATRTKFNTPRSEEETVLISASDPLPGDTPTSEGYKPLGVITVDGRLVSWDRRSHMAKWTVDLAIAAKLMDNRWDCQVLQNETGRNLSLEGCLRTYRPVREYLTYFAETYGEDYLSGSEPDKRWEQLTEMTEEQQARWRGHIGLQG